MAPEIARTCVAWLGARKTGVVPMAADGAPAAAPAPAPVQAPASAQRIADVPMGSLPGLGHLVVPRGARLLVLCFGDLGDIAGIRLQQLAGSCAAQGLATLQFDLLSAAEHTLPPAALDADLSAQRLAQALSWAQRQSALAGLYLGLLGAGAGAAAALGLAAAKPGQVAAVVACGGRLDLPARCLMRVSAPTLLVVGSGDPALLVNNRAALLQLGGKRRLEVVPGDALLFNAPGAMATVSALAGEWFANCLRASRSGRAD